ncbi:MAG: hypothetical protein IJS68_03425 [Clostridia bacterium]|nr:hypothetical protein [Clostridia bacterium]
MQKIDVMYHVKYFHIKAIPYMYYLSKINLKLHFSKLNYYEKFAKMEYAKIKNLAKFLSNLDSKCFYCRYRGVNGTPFVEYVATFVATNCLKDAGFNAVAFFNDMTRRGVFFKKECNVFYYLFLRALLVSLIIDINHCFRLDKLIKHGGVFARQKSYGLKADCLVYGALLRNKKPLNQLQKHEIIATKNVFSYFDDCKRRMRIVFNWFKFLESKRLIRC